jgi:hypothetical protein
VHDVLALGQVLELDQAGVQPVLVGLLGGELGLDLVVLDDAAWAVSTRNIRPGCSRPLRTTLAGSMSRTPTSEASTTGRRR